MSLTTNVSQAMRVLELLASEETGLGVTTIAEELGVNKAIAHRLLAVLVELGYVEQDPHVRQYRASHRVGALGIRQLEAAGLERWAQDPLDRLATETRHLVRLAVATDHRLQWIAKAQGARSRLVLDPAMGAEVVLHATASGKAYLATLPADELDAVLEARPLTAQTAYTITDEGELRSELERVREHGFAVVSEEMDLGISAIAAPVLGEADSGRATGTVSVAGPTAQLSRDELEAFAPALLRTGEELAQRWPVRDYGARQSAVV